MSDRDELRKYIEWFGGIHTGECPADDTCDCQWSPVNAAVNRLCAAPVSGEAPRPDPPDTQSLLMGALGVDRRG